jgi:hypothetical protein
VLPTNATAPRLRRLLRAALEAHMNTVRVWGGGGYPADALYDYADAHGLLLWQESGARPFLWGGEGGLGLFVLLWQESGAAIVLGGGRALLFGRLIGGGVLGAVCCFAPTQVHHIPSQPLLHTHTQNTAFACSPYPRDAAFLASAAAEARRHARRLTGRPSLAVWGGNNEVEASFESYPETRDNPRLYAVDYADLFVSTVGREIARVRAALFVVLLLLALLVWVPRGCVCVCKGQNKPPPNLPFEKQHTTTARAGDAVCRLVAEQRRRRAGRGPAVESVGRRAGCQAGRRPLLLIR